MGIYSLENRPKYPILQTMQKISIYPSVLAIKEDPTSWDSRVSSLGITVSGIHYDIGDGEFVPSMMLPVENIDYLSKSREQKAESKGEDFYLPQNELPIDVHLMVRKPSMYFSTILDFEKVAAVAFHIECDEDIHETIQTLKNAGKKVGLAILDVTPVDHLDPYLLEIDYVLVMTVKGGYSGTPFISEMLEKIREIHHKNPELPILVDGGVAEQTLPLCIDAGATRAVMSSALF